MRDNNCSQETRILGNAQTQQDLSKFATRKGDGRFSDGEKKKGRQKTTFTIRGTRDGNGNEKTREKEGIRDSAKSIKFTHIKGSLGKNVESQAGGRQPGFRMEKLVNGQEEEGQTKERSVSGGAEGADRREGGGRRLRKTKMDLGPRERQVERKTEGREE